MKKPYETNEEARNSSYLHTFWEAGDRYFLYEFPYQNESGLEFLIATIVPASDVMASIDRNIYHTAWMIGAALLVVGCLSGLVIRRLTKRLIGLNRVAQKITQGNFDQPIEGSHIRESDDLAQSWQQQSWQQMMTELKRVDTMRLNNVHDLERQVAEQTTKYHEAELRLQEIEARQAAILSALPDVIFILNADGIYLDSVSMFNPIDVVTPDVERIGRPVNELVPPDLAARHQAAIQQVVETGKPYVYEQCIQNQDKLQYEEVHCVPMEGNRILFAIRDISDRKQAEIALSESELRFQEIAHTIEQKFFIRSVKTGAFLYVSPAYEKMYGRSCESLYENPDDWMNAVHPDDKEYVSQSVYQQFDQDSVTREFRIFRPDGEMRWILTQVNLTRDNNGQPDHLVGIATDITDHKQAELALEQSEARLRKLAEASPAIVYTVVERPFEGISQFEYLSPAAETIHELPIADLRHNGALISAQIHPDDREQYFQAVAASLETMQLFSHEWRIITPSGKIKWLQANSRPERRETGEVVWHGIVIEVSDRKQAEEELKAAKEAAEAANKAKSTFIANMNHELRSPLNAILGFAQLLKLDHTLSPEQRENVEIIESSGEHLLSLINQILDLAKIESSRTTFDPTTVDLHKLLDNVCQLFTLRAEHKGIQLIVEKTPHVPATIQTDAMKLRQILINLIDNAIKFTDNGHVALRISADDNLLYFEVQDTGAGIASDDFDMVFGAFQQTKVGQNQPQGTGLGLTITQKFVELIGGNITLESQIGEGSTFRFHIPIHPPTQENFTQSDVDSDPGIILEALHNTPKLQEVVGLMPKDPHYRFLVVDDNAIDRRLLTHMLSVFSIEIQEAVNGEEAIALWQSWHPHIIFMDMQMPVMEGYEAIRCIRQQQKAMEGEKRGRKGVERNNLSINKAPGIIAITASAFEQQRDKMFEAGCDDVIYKPFHMDELYGAIARHLGVQCRNDSSSTSQENNDSLIPSTSPTTLTANALTVMPSNWQKKLYHAAIILNANECQHLIAQIPQEYEVLGRSLKQLIHDFRFDIIAELVQSSQSSQTYSNPQ